MEKEIKGIDASTPSIAHSWILKYVCLYRKKVSFKKTATKAKTTRLLDFANGFKCSELDL